MAIQTFRKRINNEKMRFFLPCGSGIKEKFMLHIDDNGCECLVCSGTHDLYAEIQSYRDSCDLAMVLRNMDPLQVQGLVSSYSVDDLMNSGITDYSTMPKSIGGLFNLVKQGENMFNGLPEEVRSQFNYSVKNFVSKFGTQEFNDIINKFYKPQNTTNEPQNSTNEPQNSTNEPQNSTNEPISTNGGDK